MHTFDQWFSELNERMIAEHYHAVQADHSLTMRLYLMYKLAPNRGESITIADAVSILHQQWVNDANRFAAKLLEQTIQGVQYTVWHEFLANNTGDRGK